MTAGLLFALCCVSSVLYGFYGDWWNVSELMVAPISDNGDDNDEKPVAHAHNYQQEEQEVNEEVIEKGNNGDVEMV